MGAEIDYGISEHPQAQMRKLGFHVIKSEPFPIGDCWWFRVDNDIENVPEYLHEMRGDFKFSDEYSASNEEQVPKRPPLYNPDGSLTDYGKYEFAKTDDDLKEVLRGFER